MREWFPRLKVTGVGVPDTEWVQIRTWEEAQEFSEGVRMPDMEPNMDAIDSVNGPPAFIRSDQTSHKHGMEEASKVSSDDPEVVRDNVFELLNFNNVAGFGGLPYTHLAVREWLDLEHHFKAFKEMPVGPEVRMFLLHGEIWDWGFYWEEEAIESGYHTQDLPENWRAMLNDSLEVAKLGVEEELQDKAKKVGEEFDEGYWSLDFALTEDGDWYAIDMALGGASYHPPGVEKPPKPE
jgi:hypothetical protein